MITTTAGTFLYQNAEVIILSILLSLTIYFCAHLYQLSLKAQFAIPIIRSEQGKWFYRYKLRSKQLWVYKMIKNSNLKHYLGMMSVLLIGSLIISGCGPEQKGDLEATGTIEMTEVSVGAKVGGKVEKIFVEEGQAIKSQALLAELDHEELDAQIAAAQANLDLANFR